MGYFNSKLAGSQIAVAPTQENDRRSVKDFKVYPLELLRKATNNFSPDFIVLESGEEAPIFVYKGEIDQNRWIAVKRFPKTAWPDAKQFMNEALGVGQVQHERLVNLIGACCEGDERLLVAEHMPNDTLAKHLFHWKKQPMQSAMRLRVAFYIAQALEHCSNNDRHLYYDLNPYRVLFDQHGDPRLSSFGLMKNSSDGKCYSTKSAYTPPEYLGIGRVIAESVIYSYGTMLLDLLSGKHIPPNHLKAQFSNEDGMKLVELAALCRHHKRRKRPSARDLVQALSSLHQNDIPSYVMMGLRSPLGDACARNDLAAMHKILVRTGYKDDVGTNDELSFEFWTKRMQKENDLKLRGDACFREKNFKSAIDFYTQVVGPRTRVSPTIFARRSLAYLLTDKPETARRDAVQAQYAHPDWPTAFYLQAAALARLGMETEAKDMLGEGAALEARWKGMS